MHIQNSRNEVEMAFTYSILCKNSPLGRLNFLMLSADADAKECLIKKSWEIIKSRE